MASIFILYKKTSNKTGFTLVCYSFAYYYISVFQKSQIKYLIQEGRNLTIIAHYFFSHFHINNKKTVAHATVYPKFSGDNL